MTRFIVQAIYNGTSKTLAIPGNRVDDVMLKLRRNRQVRGALVFSFISRKTGKIVDIRYN